MAEIPHFSLPFRLDGSGGFAVNEQGSNAEIADCVQAIVRYPLGYLDEQPEFGIPGQEFRQGGASQAEIDAAISRWEGRADQLTSVELDELVACVRIEVRGGSA